MKWTIRAFFLCALVGVSEAQWVEQARLEASDGAALDWLGYTGELGDDTVVLGAYRDDHVGPNAGSAYVYVRGATGWEQEAKLVASDASAHDWFAYDVAISGDTIVVGAPEDDIQQLNRGSAYVFVRSGTTWTQQAKLVAADGSGGDEFGAAVTIAGDTIVVGSIRDDNVGGSNAGSAYVFVRSGTTWSQQAKLVASDAGSEDLFGVCELSADGNTVLVTSFHDDNASGADAGAGYVFVRSGTTWSEQAKLTASDGAAGDQLGLWAALSGDTALLGAFQDDNAAGVDAGAAYVFVRSGTTWSEQAKLTASDAAGGDNFGVGVAIDGDRALVGAWLADLVAGVDAGAAYLFRRSGTSWSEQAKLTASDAAAADRFGVFVDLAGERALVGAHLDDNGGGTNAGSGYVFCVNAATAAPYVGDGINVDVLSTTDMVVGTLWAPTVALGHSHGAGGAVLLKVKTGTRNGPNFFSPGGRPAEFLITGPLQASIVGNHDGSLGTFPPQAIPHSMCLMPWAAQAIVVGGGHADLSTAVVGVIGH